MSGFSCSRLMQATTLVVSLFACSAAQADNYNVLSDWSDAENPTGVWTYREGSNALPHVNSWQSSLGGWNTAQPAWAESENSNARLPVWFRSNGRETFPHDWLAGDVMLHSTDGINGVGNGLANLLWTSPTGGVATIIGGVWLGRDISRSVAWSLLSNGVTITGGSLSSGDAFNRSNLFLFSAGSGGADAINNLTVLPGSTLELRFVTTSVNFGDFVGVNLNISVDTNTPPGDYNNNGTVDAADYTLYRDALGTNTTLANDTTPGTVTAADLAVWQTNFGQSAGSGSGAIANAAVPEPATAAMLLVAMLSMCAHRRAVVS